MSYRLFLDDERNPKDVKWIRLPFGPWVIVRSYEDFVKTITDKGLPTFITFDHDLADIHYEKFEKFLKGAASYKELYEDCKEKTGFHCAKWLVDYCIDKDAKLPHYSVHSQNTIGSENIRVLLSRFEQFQEEQNKEE